VLIGDRLPEGYRINEIANELGVTPSWVSQRLDELRNELLLATGRFFPLSDAEWTSLKQSVRDHGVQTPIVIGEHIPLVDGRHRCIASRELGITEIPAVFLIGKTPEEERELSITLNAARRQLGQAQKRALIRRELTRDPSKSDRRIGAVCGVDHKTVGTVRNEMTAEEQASAEATGETAAGAYEPETRIDTLGRAQPAPPQRATVAAAFEEDADRPLGHAACCHGQRHAIIRDGGGYRLEAR
jgi:ParB-like nuclease domain